MLPCDASKTHLCSSAIGFNTSASGLTSATAAAFPTYPYHLAAAAACAAAIASSQAVKRNERDQLEVESPSSTTQEPVNLSPGSGDPDAKPAARSGMSSSL